ncbi:MAG: hypothetical protein Q8900_06850 [Bacillota bacterium]|nr:hypothetical protein [Bacillota bacterium]
MMKKVNKDLKQTITIGGSKLDDKAKEARNKYMRNYRKKNPQKIKLN